MANKITDETLEYVGILAKLELQEGEKEQAKEDMERMIAYIEELNELDTEGIEPMSHIFATDNVFREDVVTNGDCCDEILRNAPGQKEGMFQVPKTVE
ncbi:MAG: Asp-tRNA(Asn)/Glu-tRNA(Gln) amidotransferase subunit GatC [Eubacteriales bacterium]